MINKHINHDLKLIVHWFRANRISLNVDKTDIILFLSKNKKVDKKLNFRIRSQNVIPATHTKYLGILLDQHLSWDQHLIKLKQKLSRVNGLLAKTRYYVPPNLRRPLYFSIFESHLRYGCQIWGHQKRQHINGIENLQRKAVSIMNFKSKYVPSKLLFIDSKIMTFQNIIKSENR